MLVLVDMLVLVEMLMEVLVLVLVETGENIHLVCR